MIELQAGRLRCELLPELGGAIAGFWRDGEPVLRSAPAAQLVSALQSACFALVPFANRVGHASVEWQGTQHPLIRNQGDAPHAIHGLGWQRPWAVLDHDGNSAMLAYEHRPDAAWPFAFDCSHTLRLVPDALEMTLALTNQAAQPAPAGLGWQPWFVKRPGSRITLRGAGRGQTGLDADCAGLTVDQCFDGWDGVVQLRDAVMQVRIASGLTRVVVFTEPGRDCVAIEPVSHAVNAVHLQAQGAPAADLGLVVLQPGETMMAQMTIAVEAAR